jgi:hypothetical protein
MIIIAACVPLLKGPIERMLGQWGLPTVGPAVRDINRIDSVAHVTRSGAWPEEGRRLWSVSGDVDVGRDVVERSQSDTKASSLTIGGSGRGFNSRREGRY